MAGIRGAYSFGSLLNVAEPERSIKNGVDDAIIQLVAISQLELHFNYPPKEHQFDLSTWLLDRNCSRE